MPKVEYMEIPEGLLIPCAVPDDHPTTNGELLESWKRRMEAMRECAAKIEALRKLQEQRHAAN